MNLAIEIHREEHISSCALIEREIQGFSDLLITSDDLEKIKSSKWYFPLKACDKKSVLDTCTNNQLLTAIYFYIDLNPASEPLMKQWFIDTGCSIEIALELASLVYSARIIRLHEEIEVILDDFSSTNLKKENLPEIVSLNINEIIKIMKAGNPIRWCFDSISRYQSDDVTVIELSVLKETKIALEDHHSIIIGFSVNYTTLLEFMSAENEDQLSTFSNYVEIGLRDKLSIGSLLTTRPEIIKDIAESLNTHVSFYGIKSDGRLTSYKNNPDYTKICLYDKDSEYKLMPLFIKFHK